MVGWLTGTGCKRAAIAAIGVLALASAGCASSSGSSTAQSQSRTPVQEVQLAASTAGGVNSFTATISMNLTTKVASVGAETVTVAGTVSELVRPSPLAEFTFSTLKAAGLSLPGGMSEIITPTEVYVRQAGLGMLLHTDKRWLGLSLSALSGSSGGLNLGGLFSSSDTSNPLTMTLLLAGAKDVKKVGTGTVDGVPVTQYTGSYSLAAAVGKLPANVRSGVSSAFKQAGLDTGTAEFTVWIDAQNIVRKDTTTLTSSAFSESLTTTVTSVNQQVSITPPPAGQVFAVSPAALGAATT